MPVHSAAHFYKGKSFFCGEKSTDVRIILTYFLREFQFTPLPIPFPQEFLSMPSPIPFPQNNSVYAHTSLTLFLPLPQKMNSLTYFPLLENSSPRPYLFLSPRNFRLYHHLFPSPRIIPFTPIHPLHCACPFPQKVNSLTYFPLLENFHIHPIMLLFSLKTSPPKIIISNAH